jgi:hypothetical protein
MSSTAVRAAVVAYLTSTDIQGLRKVYQAEPYWVDGAEWNFAIDLGSATVGFVHLSQESESRITVPVLTGQKQVTYKVTLYLIYQYLLTSAATVAVSEDAWVTALDATIDAVKDLLRADPNCGVPLTVFESAQDRGDLLTKRGDPFLIGENGGSLGSWTSIEWTVTEIVTA